MPHHPTLTILDVTLQATIQVLRQAHPQLDGDDQAPYNDDTPADLVLAEILVTSAQALLQTLRHYRALQQDDVSF